MPFDLDFSKFKGCGRALFVVRMFNDDTQVEKESFAKVMVTEDAKRGFVVKRPPDYQLPTFNKFVLNTVADDGEVRHEIAHHVREASMKKVKDCDDGRCEFAIILEDYVRWQ